VDYRLTLMRATVGDHGFELRCLRDFDEAVDQMFEELEEGGAGEQLIELCPFFGKLWPAARALSAYLAALGTAGLAGRQVLEVGCGLALPSLVAARLGAVVTASDFHPDVAAFLQDNVARNGLGDVAYRVADWRAPALDLGRFDLVIGSDILYDREHALGVSLLLQRHTRPGGRVVITDPGRAYLQEFASRMRDLGFASDLRVEQVRDEVGLKDVFLLEFRRDDGH
jgi:predicted nicotinamide N-methyase